MKIDSTMHHIRRHILGRLAYKKWCKFSEMRPQNVDSNLYNYHLKELMKEKFIERVEGKGYRLTPRGLRYADHVSAKDFETWFQAKIITMMIIINSKGELLLWLRKKQPFIDSWTLPNGKAHYEDKSLADSVERDCIKFFNAPPSKYRQLGVAEINAKIKGEVISHVIAHLYLVEIDYDSVMPPQTKWFKLDEIKKLRLAPAIEDILKLDLKSEHLTYNHFDIDW